MEDTTQKRTGRFNKDLAKKIEDQIADYEGPADSQGVEIKSPGKMFWFTIAGDNYNDIPKVWTVKLFDPDGEEIEYLILADDISLRDRIFEKCDNKQNLKALVRCINWFGTEFLWIPSIRTRGNSKISQQSAKRAIELGQNGWIKAQWKNNSVGWVLSDPRIFLNSVGDITLLPLVLAAASQPKDCPDREEMVKIGNNTGLASIFGI